MKSTSLIVALALVLSACGSGADAESDSSSIEPTTTSSSQPPPTNTTSTAATSTSAATPLLEPQELPLALQQSTLGWETDFSKATIDLDELLVGIPSLDPRDAIRPIDDPKFEDVAVSEWIEDREPGVLLEIDGDARFYPLSILTRHEIVNDTFGDMPVAVTYCPLCNTALVFDRRFEDEVLRLGVSGLLRNSDLVMWDDVTQTLWQQITGEAIVGDHAGKQLTPIGSAIVRWADFKSTHPDGTALGPNQGFGAGYGYNPYQFYSSRETPFGFFKGEIDDRYPALERVVGLSLGAVEIAYPFSILEEARVANDLVDGQPVVVFWGAADTADALDDSTISESVGIGTAIAYDASLEGRTLTFEAAGDTIFKDEQTGTTWSILGRGLEGELAGAQLELIPHRNEFWFAWQGFFPEGEVWEG